LRGLENYYSEMLALPTLKGDPFSWGLVSYQPSLAPVIREIGTNLTVACGLCLKI